MLYTVPALLLLLALAPLQAKSDSSHQLLALRLAEAISAAPSEASTLTSQATTSNPEAATLLLEKAMAATVGATQSTATLKSVLKSVYENSRTRATANPAQLAAALGFHAARGAVSIPSAQTKEILQALAAQSVISAYGWGLGTDPIWLTITIVSEIVRGSGQPASVFGPAIAESAVYALVTQLGTGGITPDAVQRAMNFDVQLFAEALSKELGLGAAESDQLRSAALAGRETALRSLAGVVQTATLAMKAATQNAVVPGAVTPVVER